MERRRWKRKEFVEALLKYSKADSALFNVVVDDVIIPTSRFHEDVFAEG